MKKFRTIIAICMVALLTLPLFASGSGETAEADPNKLVVWQFRGCNLEDQIKQYGEENGIEIDLQVIDRDTMMNNLMTSLASGAGLPDFVTIGGPFIEKFKANPQHFVNFNDYGNYDDVYLDWRLDQLKTADGKSLVGLPTDIGPILLAYRKDIFEAAGLPSDRDELQKLVTCKEDLLEIGLQVKEATGKPLVANIENIFQSLLGQDSKLYWNDKGELNFNENPEVLDVWNYCVKLHELGLSANIKDNTSEWGAGLANGDFAAQIMPAWRVGGMKGNAPETAGLWGLLVLPGTGNWGGSMVSVPAKAKNPEGGVKLAQWLMSPEQQLVTFKHGGQFPTTVANYSNPELTGYVDPFFGDDPLGQLLSESAKLIEGSYLGPDYATVVQILVDGMTRIEAGEQTPDESFKTCFDTAVRTLSR